MATAEINIDFGNRVKSQREYCKISQRELAKKAGISQSYISRMETSGWIPSYRIIVTIAKVLHTDTDYLFNKASVEPKKEEKNDISPAKNLEVDEALDDSNCKNVVDLVQKNLDHLFKVTGDQFFVSPKTSLYLISEICKHYKISASYLFEDHEKEWLKEEIENKYKEIEEMETKVATLEDSK